MTNSTNSTNVTKPVAGLPCSTDEYPQCYAAKLVWMTLPVLLFVVGNLGNILSVVVLCRRQIRKYSVASYLLILALSDLTFLWTSVFRNMLFRGYQIDVKELWTVTCKLNDWGTMTSGTFSSFIVTILTIERTVMTRWPRSQVIKSTPTSVRIILLTVGVVIGLANAHLIYGYKTVTQSSVVSAGADNVTLMTTASTKCVFVSQEYRQFYASGFRWIVLLVFNVVPVVIIATGNIIIAVTLKQQKNRIQQQQSSDITAGTAQQNSRSKNATRTLFILSAFYMMTVTPYCVFAIVQYRFADSTDPSELATLSLVHALVYTLGYCNFSLNFFMYSMGASLFKKEWQAWWRSCVTKLSNLSERFRETIC